MEPIVFIGNLTKNKTEKYVFLNKFVGIVYTVYDGLWMMIMVFKNNIEPV